MRRLSVLLVTFSLLGLSAASALARTHVELRSSLSGSKHFPHAHGRARPSSAKAAHGMSTSRWLAS